VACLQTYGQIAGHFSRWLGATGLPPPRIDAALITRFIRFHLPHCQCLGPAPVHAGNCRAGLGCLLRFLRQRGIASKPPAAPPSALGKLVEEYDDHLAEVNGLSPATRLYRRRYALDFLGSGNRSGALDLKKLSAKFVAG
jgi:hypothetical protein